MNNVIVRSTVLWTLLVGVVAEVTLVSHDAGAASIDRRSTANLCSIDDAVFLPSTFTGGTARAHLDEIARPVADRLARSGTAGTSNGVREEALEQALHLTETSEFAGWRETRPDAEPAGEDAPHAADRLYSLRSSRYVPGGPLGAWLGGREARAADGNDPSAGGIAAGSDGLIADLVNSPPGPSIAADDYSRTPDVTTAVPEPGTLLLMGAALAGLGSVARRRRA